MSSQGLPQIVRDLPRAWQGLGRMRQLLLAGTAGTILLAVLGAGLFLQRTPYTTLFSGLGQADAAAVVAKLKELETPYVLEAGGSTIKVPQEQAAELRLQLAGLGIPSGSAGLIGMEVFDKTQLGVTDFAQKLNHQRALEGELTRTIGRLTPVEQARVHLVLPQERLFAAQQKDASGVVVLKLRPGTRLSDEQVTSIKSLVSRSVEGLKPADVSVVDVQGNTLGAPEGGAGTLGAAGDKHVTARLELQRQREAELERKIQTLLDRILGPNRAAVRATVTLDWDQVEQKIETFSPNGLAPQVRSQQEQRERVAGNGAGADAAGGVPGAQPNLAGPPTYQADAAGGTGQPSSYDRSSVTTNNELSSDRQSIVRAIGGIKHIGLAITVDAAAPAAQVEQLTPLVTAAAGLQAQRGDQLSVVSLPFEAAGQNVAPLAPPPVWQELYEPGIKVLGVVLAFAGLFLLFQYLSRAARPRVTLIQAVPPRSLPGTAGLGALDEGDGVMPLPLETDPALAEQRLERARLAAARQARLQADAVQRQQQLEAVAEMAKTQPDALATVLARWLEEGAGAAAGGGRR